MTPFSSLVRIKCQNSNSSLTKRPKRRSILSLNFTCLYVTKPLLKRSHFHMRKTNKNNHYGNSHRRLTLVHPLQHLPSINIVLCGPL